MLSKKKKIIFEFIIIMLLAGCAAIYYYSQLVNKVLPLHSDDAGSPMAVYAYHAWGDNQIIAGDFSLFTLISRLAYFICGYNEIGVRVTFCILFFIIMCGIFYLILCDGGIKKMYWAIPIILYMVMLQGNENVYEIDISRMHMGPIFCLILFLVILKVFSNKKIIRNCLLGITVIYSFIQSDFMLSLSILILPIFIYFIVMKVMEKNNKEKICIGIFLYACFLVLIRSLNVVYRIKTGNELISFGGWGSRVFSSPDDFFRNIKTYFIGLQGMFNCVIINKPIISIGTFNYVIRILIILLGYLCVVDNIRNLFKNKESIDSINTIISLSIVTSSILYLISGLQVDGISMRYCNIILYMLPVLLVRTISQKKKFIEIEYKNIKISERTIVALAFILLIFSYVERIDFTRDRNTLDELSQTIINEKLEYGLAPFWASNVVSILSDNQTFVEGVVMNEIGIDSYLEDYPVFLDKCNTFNYIINDQEKNDSFDDTIFGITDESINAMYGSCIKNIQVGNKTIYIYDYDLRWKPQILNMETSNYSNNNSKNIEISNKNLEMGNYYYKLNGNFEGNNPELILKDENGNIICQGIPMTNDANNVKYSIYSDKYYDDYVICISSNGNNLDIKNIEILNIRLAKDITYGSDIISSDSVYSVASIIGKESDAINLNKGNYKVVLYGENIKNIELLADVKGTNMEINRLENGNERVTFSFKAIEDIENIKFKINKCQNKNANLDNFTIEVAENYKNIALSDLECEGDYELYDNMIALNSTDSRQYGPWVTLKQGKYRIELTGENLSYAEIRSVYDCGIGEFSINLLEQNDNKVVYEIDNNKQNIVEFIAKNISPDKEAIIKSYKLYREQ